MASIFPLIGDTPAPTAQAETLPLAREFARDPSSGMTIWRGSAPKLEPVIVTGLDAVLSWAYAALATVRCRHPIYSRDFGCEIEQLIGHAYTGDVKTVEAVRMVRDALTVSPYVKDVRDVAVDFAGNTLSINCILESIYGEAEVHA